MQYNAVTVLYFSNGTVLGVLMPTIHRDNHAGCAKGTDQIGLNMSL